MLPIAQIIAAAELIAPKLKELVPEHLNDSLNKILEEHKEILEAKCSDVAEASKQSRLGWMGAYWIPILMGLLLLIVAFNYLIIPLLALFYPVKQFIIPPELWNLILIIVPVNLGFVSLNKHLDNMGNKSK